VRRQPLSNLPASVHQRLLNRARETALSFNELLQRFAMERFLYRLSQSSSSDRFVLKGALMLSVWRVEPPRSTLDIDLLGRAGNQIEEMVATMRAVCQQGVEPDGVTFDPDTMVGESIAEEASCSGVRLRFRGALGNASVPMQIDIGFGDVVVPAAEMIDYPTLLDFPAPRLSGYSRESTIAEKLHVMASLGLLTSRMKDFLDVWLLSRQFDFDGATLAQAMETTFAHRETPVDPEPEVLTQSFATDEVKVAQWQALVQRTRLSGAPVGLAEVVAHLASFVGPVVSALGKGRRFRGTWHAPGPWSAPFPPRGAAGAEMERRA
jgi:hypothetical protein